MNFNPMDYLTNDEKKELAMRAVADKMHDAAYLAPMSVFVSNAAYATVMQKVREELGEDMEDSIKDDVKEILSDPKKIEFCLFYDGSAFNENRVGVAREIAEQYARTACVEKIHGLVDRVLETIKMDTKKFEKMVMKEAAKLVAEKMTSRK